MFIDFTIDQFINNNIFLGCIKKQTLNSNFTYLLGFRKKISIIKISYSILFFKYIYNFLSQFFMNYGGLWLSLIMLRHFMKYKRQLLKWIHNINLLFIKQKFRVFILLNKWKPGVLTNYNSWRQTSKNYFNFFWYPKAIFQLNISVHLNLQYEPLKIGSIGLNIFDTNMLSYKNNYIIPGNEKTIISLLFYNKILINFILRIFFLQQLYFLN